VSAVGLEVGGTWLRGCALGPGGIVGARVRERIPQDPSRVGAALASLWERCGASPIVGLAAAPMLDDRGVVARWPSSRSYEGADLVGGLRARAVAPVVFDDVSAASVAEHLAATERQCLPSTTVLLSVGTGVGGGVVVRDALWSGARGQAMDVGHMPVPSAGNAACACGRSGCLQAVVSGRRLERAAAARELAVGDLAELALAHDPRALALLEELVAPLVEAVVVLDRVIDPDRIVVGGGVADGWLADRVSAAAKAAGCSAPVVRARWGTWAGALGAAVEATRGTGERVKRVREADSPPRFRIALVQGPNMNLVGEREPQHYGTETFEAIERRLLGLAEELGCELYSVQSNSEAQLVDWIQRRRHGLDGMVLNPAGLTAHGHGLRDAVLAAGVPFLEVHLSNIDAREPLHRESCFSSIARGRIAGLGPLGYEAGLRALLRLLQS
jgi:3-dehydroquinate dehydratase/predicted NBD/HSP70 family sugar kinase